MKERGRQKAVLWAMGWLLMALVWIPGIGNAADGSGDLVIFHTNDMHARVTTEDDGGRSIGLAELAAAVKSVEAKNPDTLWLDAGDTFHGMPRINISRGENAVPLLNEAGIDAMCPGNHDFNYGEQQLEKLSRKARFPILGANIVYKEDKKRHPFKPYKIFELPGNIKVGVFGLTTPETAYKTGPKNVENVEFLNPVETAKEMIAELRPKCDVIIALMHMGLDASSTFTSDRIAKEAPGIDLIVDGHSHTALSEGLMEGDTLIVQTGWHEYRLGRVDIRLSGHKITSKKACLLDAADLKRMAPKPDASIEKGLAKIDKRNEKLFHTVVAHSDRALTSDRLVLRRRESELGNLCADAFRWRTGADFAVVNGGGIRSDFPEGDVTKGDIMAIFPFGNTIQVAEIKGNVVRAMLEHSVFAYPASFGGFLDVSGMSFSFDPTEPAGSRVKDISIGGQPLDENRTYRMAGNDFTFSGGDDYEMLKGLPIVGEFGTCEEIMADYLNKVGMDGIETGRITVLEDVPVPDEAPDGPGEYKEAA